jgi:hypothetical protein
MTFVAGLSIDIRGLWSPVQARHVLKIITPQARLMGLEPITLDVTTLGMPVKRYLIHLRCLKHGVIVDYNTVCEMCLKGIP